MPYVDRETMQEIDQLKRFMETHGTVVSNALRVYSERMRKDGEKIMLDYKHAEQCPMARAQLEGPHKDGSISIMTVNGLKMSAEMILQAADRADDAYKDLESIENGYDEEDEEDGSPASAD